MTVYETICIMLQFGLFIIALLTLIIVIIKLTNKK